jgi:radical SAM superfamily enzyme YgiQ (UPF0313 family)
MRILYVQQYLGGDELLVMPIGLLYIATAAVDHGAKLFDMNAADRPYEELEQAISDYDPQVIALSLRNIDNQQRINLKYYYLELAKTLEVVKKTKPGVILIIGGAGFSMFARTIMQRHREIDFGVYLEGETSFPDLLDNLDSPEQVPGIYYRDREEVQFTGRSPMVDLKKLPIPRKDLIPDIKIYETGKGGIGINTKRGCPCRCSYCNYFLLNGMKVRMRDPIQIVDEIEELVNVYGIREFMFADGMFSNPFKHVAIICEEIKRRKIKVQWDAWCDIRAINQQFIDTVASAGCRFIVISPDGYSNSALRDLHKGFTTSDIRSTVKLLVSKPAPKIGFGFFLTTPGETLSGYFRTLFYYFTTVPFIMLKRRGGASLSWIRIEPDTKILEMAIRDGIVNRDTELLPTDLDSLKKLFYIKPGLRIVDPLSRAIVGAMNLLRNTIRPKRS